MGGDTSTFPRFGWSWLPEGGGRPGGRCPVAGSCVAERAEARCRGGQIASLRGVSFAQPAFFCLPSPAAGAGAVPVSHPGLCPRRESYAAVPELPAPGAVLWSSGAGRAWCSGSLLVCCCVPVSGGLERPRCGFGLASALLQGWQ